MDGIHVYPSYGFPVDVELLSDHRTRTVKIQVISLVPGGKSVTFFPGTVS